jgi:indolepyruvate ferredoxin oxidoreductase, alpha subunit
MSRLAEALCQPGAGRVFWMGNHALVRAMLEAGVRVATTYPGSPTPEIAAALEAIPPQARDYHFEYATNEKVATEIAIGAALNGRLACVFFKSVGLNVASDSLIQLSMLPLPGGLVVILGDDPGANSSQNEQDNRHFARMAYLPLFEPATPQETYEMFHEAARLARLESAAVLLRLTTHVCHAKQTVQVGTLAERRMADSPAFTPDPAAYVPVAKTVLPMKLRALALLDRFAGHSEASPFQVIDGASPQGGTPVRRGILASGLPALAVREILAGEGAPVDLFKLGLTHPLPRQRIAAFLRDHDEILIVEELDRILEQEVKVLAYEEGAAVRILARAGGDELIDEYGVERVRALIARLWPDLAIPSSRPASVSGAVRGDREPPAAPAPRRTPQLCPGCGHRSAFHAIRRALEADTITVADIGCHTMGFEPPYRLGDVLLSMGHSVATAAGLSLSGQGPKPVAFLGDSTMIHAGLPGIVDAAVHDHAVTLILLENGTTAMTGHQPRTGSGEEGARLSLGRILESLGVQFLRDVDAYSQAKLIDAIKEAQAHPGFAVVIARHPCMLKMMRDTRRRPDVLVRPVAIDPKVCDRLYTCLREFACPSFVYHEDGRVTVEPDLCIGDGSCLQTCPLSAIGRPAREAQP